MTPSQIANITRNKARRNWSVETITTWRDDCPPTYNYAPANTLNHAIYTVADWCATHNVALAAMTISESPADYRRLVMAIEDYTRGGLSYTRKAAIKALENLR